MDPEEIKDIITASNMYIKDLQVLNDSLKVAENQIKFSGDESLKNIDAVFSNLQESLITTLDNRKLELKESILTIQKDSLKPLHACQDVISEKVSKANDLIVQSNRILKNLSQKNSHSSLQLETDVLGNLPAVPGLLEVPFLNFVYTEKMKQDIISLCKNFGFVFHTSPVEISSLVEKPGGILIKWEETDSLDEKLNSIQEFRLQFAFGNTLQSPYLQNNFHDCYTGTNTEFLKKDLKADEVYSFRVCCRMEGLVEWSPWSITQTAQTTIKPFCWRKNKNFILNNDNKLATKLSGDYAVLLSDGPQFEPEYSFEFTILDLDIEDTATNTAVGLCDEASLSSLNSKNKWSDSAFILLLNGTVMINGIEKPTKLPNIRKGNKITFTCEDIQGDKVRIYVETQDKNVVYDWRINASKKMHFFVSCLSRQFKILVE